MHILSGLITLIFLSLVGNQVAHAQDVSYQYATALAMPMSLDDGKGLPLASAHILTLAVPLSQEWTAMIRGGFVTKFALFQPAPQAQLGLNRKVSGAIRLGGTLLYRYVPHWADTPSDAHVLGITGGPIVGITKEIALCFPLALTHNVTDDTTALAFVSELTFKLPL